MKKVLNFCYDIFLKLRIFFYDEKVFLFCFAFIGASSIYTYKFDLKKIDKYVLNAYVLKIRNPNILSVQFYTSSGDVVEKEIALDVNLPHRFNRCSMEFRAYIASKIKEFTFKNDALIDFYTSHTNIFGTNYATVYKQNKAINTEIESEINQAKKVGLCKYLELIKQAGT